MARADLAALRATLPAGATLVRATELPSRSRRPALLPTAHGPFDAFLGGGLPRGALVEVHGRRGKPSGRYTLALAALAAATASGEAAALVDLGDHFDPQSALAAEVELPRLLWMRPRTLKEALLSTETVVAAGFALVVLDLGLAVKGRASDASWLRLARAAADRETALLVLTPFRMVTGFAARMVVSAEDARAAWRRTNVPLLSGLSVHFMRGRRSPPLPAEFVRGRRSPPLPLLSTQDPEFQDPEFVRGTGSSQRPLQSPSDSGFTRGKESSQRSLLGTSDSEFVRGRESSQRPLLGASEAELVRGTGSEFRADRGSPGAGAVRISFQTSPLSILPLLTPDERLLPLAEAPPAHRMKTGRA